MIRRSAGRRPHHLPNQEAFEALRDSVPLRVGQIIGKRRAHPANNRDRQFRIILERKKPQTELQILHRRHSQVAYAVPQRTPQQRPQKRIGNPRQLGNHRGLALRIQQEQAVRMVLIVAEYLGRTGLADRARHRGLRAVESRRNALEPPARITQQHLRPQRPEMAFAKRVLLTDLK